MVLGGNEQKAVYSSPMSVQPAPELAEVIYISAQSEPFTRAALTELLAVARRNNLRAGITGLLVYREGSFLQVLEGPTRSVDAVYEKITHDPRHHRIIRMSRRVIPSRSFGEWTMGYVEDDESAKPTDGFNDYFEVGLKKARFEADDPERIRPLLQQFAMGRWRQHVR